MKNYKIFGYIPIFPNISCYAQVVFQEEFSKKLYLLDGDEGKGFYLKQYNKNDVMKINGIKILFKEEKILNTHIRAYYIPNETIVLGTIDELIAYKADPNKWSAYKPAGTTRITHNPRPSLQTLLSSKVDFISV